MTKYEVAALLTLIVGLPTALNAQDAPKDGPGKDVFVQRCSTCHQPEAATGHQHTKAEWNDVVMQMIQNGAVVPDDDRTVIVDYLATNYGPPASAPQTPAAPKH